MTIPPVRQQRPEITNLASLTNTSSITQLSLVINVHKSISQLTGTALAGRSFLAPIARSVQLPNGMSLIRQLCGTNSRTRAARRHEALARILACECMKGCAFPANDDVGSG